MATGAARLECKESTGRKEKTKRENKKSEQKKTKTHLTHTGLLMEGVGRVARTFALAGANRAVRLGSG